MTLKKISPNIYILPFDKERDRPNIGYIHGEKYSLLIDTGNSPAHLNDMLNEIKLLDLPKPTVALITHWHWDHTFAMHAFDGITVAERETNQMLKKLETWKWTKEDMQQRLVSGEECEFCDTHIKIEYEDVSTIQVVHSNIEFEDHIHFDLGNITIEVQRMINPHSDDGVIAYCKEEQVLFAGDADSGEYYLLDGGYDNERFYHYIKSVDKYDFNTYIHGHLDPMNKEELKSFWKQIEAEDL